MVWMPTAGLQRRRVGLAFAGYAVGQLALLALLYVGYGLVRHLADGSEVEAFGNAADVWGFERFLRLPDEAAIQQAALGVPGLATAANYFYLGVHFPAAVAFLIWVFVRHRNHWPRVRNVIVATTGAAMVIHVLYPLAPPRFLPAVLPGVDLVDTGAEFGPSPYGKGSGLANQYAAMPSLHVGWALVEAWAVVTILKGRARWVVVAQPLLTFAVVVVTANHYWVDGLVGGLLVAVAVAVMATSRGLRDAVAGAAGRRRSAPTGLPSPGLPSPSPGLPSPRRAPSVTSPSPADRACPAAAAPDAGAAGPAPGRLTAPVLSAAR